MPRPHRSWSVYILRCQDGSLYTGATNDLGRRLERHAAGKGARYTRSRLPVRLVYVEHAKNRGAAVRREVALKRLTRAEKLALVAAAKVRRWVKRGGGADRAAPTASRPARLCDTRRVHAMATKEPATAKDEWK